MAARYSRRYKPATEFDRLSAKGVRFVQPQTPMGPVTAAVLDDTCGSLIQIASMAD